MMVAFATKLDIDVEVAKIAGSASDRAYTPPHPPRSDKRLGPISMIRKGRHNLLSIWSEPAFEKQFFSSKILFQHVFVANSPDIVRTVFVDRADNYQSKSAQQRHALSPLLGDGLFISDGETWRERRRIIAQVTHVSRMEQLSTVMSTVAAEQRVQWFEKPPGITIDVLNEMGKLTAEIICRSLFGRALRPGTARLVVAAFRDYQASIGQVDMLSLLGLPEVLPRFHGRRVKRSAARIRAVVDELVDAVLAEPGRSDQSLIGAMAAAPSPITGMAMTREAFRNEAIVLFMAGHETTANTLAWAWFLLSQVPWAESAVQREADALGGRPATYGDLTRLPFIEAVVRETLRLYPPVPIQARRAAKADCIRGRAVPEGALVILVPWLLHRHRQLWENADQFMPQRWLPGGSGTPSRYAFVPFSIGPRVCTGAAFGLSEAVICLATLAAKFRLRLAPAADVQPVCRLTLRPGATLPMILEPRTTFSLA